MRKSNDCSTISPPLDSAPPRGLAKLFLNKSADAARACPNTFMEYVFADPSGRPLVQSAVHLELQNFLTAHPKALIELPRDHGKSTQLCGRVLWELGRRPGLRVKLVCGTERIAEDRSRFLRATVAGNPRLRTVFPSLTPADPWAADAFTVNRPAETIGPSVAAFGVGSGSTGARADLLVCDDVVDVSAVFSPADRDRVSGFVTDNLLNLLEPDGRFWNLSTPWHADDANARLARNPAFARFRRPVGPHLEPVWPERWPTEALAARRAEIGAAAFARGYHLNPVSETETPIRAAWITTWTTPPSAFDRVVLAVDPAVSAAATADASAVVALGLAGGDVYCLEASGLRVTMPDLVRALAAADRRRNPDVVLFESNAAFAGVRDLLKNHAGFGHKIVGVVATRAKAARVAAFAVAVENGRFRLAADGSQAALAAEMTAFPFGEHDDLLDAAAAGTAFLLSGGDGPRAWGL